MMYYIYENDVIMNEMPMFLDRKPDKKIHALEVINLLEGPWRLRSLHLKLLV